MKCLALIMALCVGWSLAWAAPKTNFSPKTQSAPAKTANVQFVFEPAWSRPRVGEKIIFDVYWTAFHIGEGTVEVKEIIERGGRQAYHFEAHAKSNDFLSRFYPVNDEVHSYVDVEHFRTLEFRKILREGRYRADERVTYDYKTKSALYESLKNKTKKNLRLESDSLVDILACFYWFRMQNGLQIGKHLSTKIHGDEKNWDAEIDILKFEEKNFRKKQSYSTVVVEPKTRYKGVLRQRGRAHVWFTVDARRLPVAVHFKTPFGQVRGVLREYYLKDQSNKSGVNA